MVIGLDHKSEENLRDIVIISRDPEFVSRLRTFALKVGGPRTVVTAFNEALSALVHMLTYSPYVVVFDMDLDSVERNVESLRAIRLVCRNVPIILGAFAHSTSPFQQENDVGIFYRLLKSAPDAELEAALESAKRCVRR